MQQGAQVTKPESVVEKSLLFYDTVYLTTQWNYKASHPGTEV